MSQKDNIEQLEKKAKQGDGKAQSKLIEVLLKNGHKEQAVKWLHALEKVNSNLMLTLARFYETGMHVQINYAEAIKRYRRLELSNSYARYRLGLMYEKGLGLKKNFCEAIDRYRQIESKEPQAQYRLGLMYEEGWGVEKNYAKARELYSKASKKVPEARVALKRISSLIAESECKNEAAVNRNDLSVTSPKGPKVSVAVVTEPESTISSLSHDQTEQQSGINTVELAQIQPKPELPFAQNTVTSIHDKVELDDATPSVEKSDSSNPLLPDPNVPLLGDTSTNVNSERFVDNPKEHATKTQWECNEPPIDAKWPKTHLYHKADRDAGLFLIRRRGRSHEHDAKFCDDDGDFWRHASGWTVLAVADGAGSAEYSREGSRIAVTTVLEEFEHWFTEEKVSKCDAYIYDWEHNHDAFYQLFYFEFFEICKKIILKIKALAQQHNLNERQFATTLLVSVSKTIAGKTYLASLWIGDGAMVAFRQGATRLLGSADTGSFIGQTRFLDTHYLQKHYQFSVSIAAIEQAEALILMTDGISDPKFKSDADLGEPSCWDDLWQEIALELAKENPEQALLEWLHFLERGYHDDRTLLISLVQAEKELNQR